MLRRQYQENTSTGFQIHEKLGLLNFLIILRFRKLSRKLNIESTKKNKARLNEIEPEETDKITTPDIVLSVQISQGLNNNKTKNVRVYFMSFCNILMY